MNVFLHGITLGASLIIAVGPQNLFVMRESTSRSRACLVTLVCGLCDTALIAMGGIIYGAIVGLSGASSSAVAATFMAWYGIRALLDALKESRKSSPAHPTPASSKTLVAQALGFSLLNPVAIIDTLVVVAGSAQQYSGTTRAVFLGGAIATSWLWFAGVSLGSLKLRSWGGESAAWAINLISAALLIGLSTQAWWKLLTV